MKYWKSGLFMMFATLLSANSLAHSVVTPTTGTAGAKHQFFSVTAPTEGDIPCIAYRLEVPPEWKSAGGQIDRVRRDPLWDITVEKDDDGWIRSVTWSGSEVPGYSFARFDLIVSLPKLTGLQQIKIWQTYADGTVVGWVDDRSGEKVAHPSAGLTLTAAEKE
jgi:hypothetical protein